MALIFRQEKMENFFTMYKTHDYFSAMSRKVPGIRNNGKSETIPGQATTPQELLRNYVQHKPLGLNDSAYIFDSDYSQELPEMYKMDKMDRLHFAQENRDKITNLSNVVNDYKHRKASEAKLKAQQEANEAKRKEATQQVNSEQRKPVDVSTV